MLLLPIGHEDARLRRVPWVTFGIMILCGVAFLLSGRAHPLALEDERLERDVLRAARYWAQHRYLDLDEAFRERVFAGSSDADAEAALEALAATPDPGGPPDVEGRRAQQRRLDALVARATAALEGNQVLAWGLVPRERRPATFLTHMFLHAGWAHLLGNMLFLFVAAPLIEDVWGRPTFALLYLGWGLAAAWSHIGVDPASSVPMVGASGAIAGVMGAFLVRAGATKIRILWLIAACGGTFAVPAWILLPVWLVAQLGFAALSHGSGAGVAYWAHIGGFVAGAGTAVLVAATRAETRWLRPALDRRTGDAIVDNARLDAALDARAAGRTDDAFGQLRAAVTAGPDNPDAVSALRDVAAEESRFAEAAPALLAAIRARLRRREDRAAAVELWAELLGEVPDVAVEPAVLIRLGQALAAERQHDLCRRTLHRAVRAARGRMTAPAALRVAAAARFADATLARQAVEYALARPDLDPETRARAERLQAELGSLPALV